MSKPKHLVIVESPAKAKTIEKFLGKDYVVKASFGHVRDLPQYKLGVDVEQNFEPSYSTMRDKTKVLKELKTLAKKSDTIYLATDPDREGEAIAWHIQEAIDLEKDKFKRIIFSEITKTAIQGAIHQARQLNMHLVDAQQARRILDRLIGYKLSPILSKKIQRGLSAGRVQSVAVKLICEREAEITAFVPEEYWVLELALTQDKSAPFTAKLIAKDDPKSKLTITNETEAKAVEATINASALAIESITSKPLTRNPYAPFITSTLQQEASRRFNWTTKKTMVVAQQLYEGIQVDEEAVGLITYMRTDSVRIANEALDAARSLIRDTYGSAYCPDKPRLYKAKGQQIQDAHECIRPTYIDFTPKDIKAQLSEDQFKLYGLIWARFISCQMASAKLLSTQVMVKSTHKDGDYFFKATGSQVQFDGFKKVYEEQREDGDAPKADDQRMLPPLDEANPVDKQELLVEQKFTQPPPRYTEASLIKTLEENGIGRPSTYAPTMGTIQDRGYVDKTKRQLSPTDLGVTVNTQLEKFFHDILNVNFTAKLEHELDEIMEGHHDWHDVVSTFYSPFSDLVTVAHDKMEMLKKDKPTDETCEKCGHPMVIKNGRYGEFKACSNYPECKNTQAIVVEVGVDCPDCSKAIVEKRTRKGKVFYGCSGFPKCKFALWDKPLVKDCPHCESKVAIEKNKKEGKMIVCAKCEKDIQSVD